MDEQLSWGSHIDHICSKVGDGIGLIRRINLLPLYAARIINGKYNDVPPSVELLANLQWTSLETKRINWKLLFAYKIINGHTAPNLRNKFRFNYETELPNLRNSSIDLALPKPNKNFGKRCFNFSAAVLWNNLLYEAKIAPTV